MQGHLGGSWLGKLAGMVITSAFKESEQPVTILEGLLLDQAALSGVLNALHELHLELLSVECLDTYYEDEVNSFTGKCSNKATTG